MRVREIRIPEKSAAWRLLPMAWTRRPNGGVIEEDPAHDADDQHHPDADPDTEDGIAAADPLEEPGIQVVARDRRGVGDDQPQTAVETERTEGDDDGRNAERDAERAVQQTADRGDDHADRDRDPDRVAVPQRDGHHDAAQHPDRSDREVDIAHGDDEDHPHGHDADVGRLSGDIDEVLCGEEGLRHQQRQQHDEDDQRAKDADLVDLADPAYQRAESAREAARP